MDLREAQQLATGLMTEHGVGSLEFKFTHGKNRLGACWYRTYKQANGRELKFPYRITLSKHFVALLSTHEVEQTILHEIAHALTPGDHHGAKWQATAKRLGHTGSRCSNVAVRPPHSITGTCPVCLEVVAHHHRLPKRVSICIACKAHRQPLIYKRNGVTLTLSDMTDSYREEFIRRYR